GAAFEKSDTARIRQPAPMGDERTVFVGGTAKAPAWRRRLTFFNPAQSAQDVLDSEDLQGVFRTVEVEPPPLGEGGEVASVRRKLHGLRFTAIRVAEVREPDFLGNGKRLVGSGPHT